MKKIRHAFFLAVVCSMFVLQAEAGEVYDCSAGHHQYEVEILVPAGQETDGLRQYTCQLCGYRYTESIPKYGHEWSEWITDIEPGCTTEGHQYRECIKTWHEPVREEKTLPALGHEYGDWIVGKKASEKEPGYRYKICRRDSRHVIKEEIPRLPPSKVTKKRPVFDTADAVLIGGSVIIAAVFGVLIYMDLLVIMWARRIKKRSLEKWKAGESLYDG